MSERYLTIIFLVFVQTLPLTTCFVFDKFFFRLLPVIESFIIMKRAKDQFSCFCFFTTSIVDENYIPGSVLDMNKLSSYRVDELKFWLSCQGDSLKNLSTNKCQINPKQLSITGNNRKKNLSKTKQVVKSNVCTNTRKIIVK